MIFKNVLSDSLVVAIACVSFIACQPKQSVLVENEFETYIVEKGDIEEFVKTDGIVAPANEVILISPAPSVVKSIVNEPGRQVKEGDVIIKLQTKPIEETIENLNDQLAVKQNNLEKNRLNAESIKADLSYNAETKKLKISSIKSTLVDQKQLLEVGGISQAKYDATKQELVLAEKELNLVKQKNAIKLAQLEAEEKGLILQIEMQQKELKQQQELLGQMDIKAPSDGIVLSIHAKEGEKIQGDKLIAVLSDLSRLKVNAAVDGKYKSRIKTGRKAYVILDNERLEGRIGTIMPQLESGNLQFSIFLLDNNHPKLIPNQKVELDVVTRARYDVLKLKNGDLINNRKKDQELYIVHSDSAILKEVKVGFSNGVFYEVKEGLNEGEEVVISSKSALNNIPVVKIQKQ